MVGFKDSVRHYEGTTRFTSNQTMNKVIVDLLGVDDYASENSKKRPDFVVLDNSTIGTFSSYSYKGTVMSLKDMMRF